MCYLPTPERVFDLSCVFLATDLGRVQQRERVAVSRLSGYVSFRLSFWHELTASVPRVQR